jgi:hypothetical protein
MGDHARRWPEDCPNLAEFVKMIATCWSAIGSSPRPGLPAVTVDGCLTKDARELHRRYIRPRWMRLRVRTVKAKIPRHVSCEQVARQSNGKFYGDVGGYLLRCMSR